MRNPNDPEKKTESDRVAAHMREYQRVEVRNALSGDLVELTTQMYQHATCARLPPAEARALAADLFVAAWLNSGSWAPYPEALTLDEIIAARDRVQAASRF